MKKIIFIIAIAITLISCDKKSKVEIAVEAIPLKLKVERFDKLFFETPPKDLHKLKREFPYFFPPQNNDSIWLNKMKNPLWRELYTEVQKKYSNFEPVQNELETLFKHLKYFFPETKIPKIITLISEMDYNNKVVYADSLVIISLELYLGKDHKFYQFPKYLKQNFEEKQMMPDVVSSFSAGKIAPVTDNNLLSQMIYFGKQLYLKDLLLPQYNDADKMGYTPAQIKWCEENESYMWRYFLEREMLYSDDQKLNNRFITPAPFSKFYLEIDNESPGRVGAWMGWQIVRSYMKNNEASITQLLKMTAKEIFEQSKYNPKKMSNSNTSEIKINIQLDENRIPEKLSWAAVEGGVEQEEAKAFMLSVWNSDEKNNKMHRIMDKRYVSRRNENFLSSNIVVHGRNISTVYWRRENVRHYERFLRLFCREIGVEVVKKTQKLDFNINFLVSFLILATIFEGILTGIFNIEFPQYSAFLNCLVS